MMTEQTPASVEQIMIVQFNLIYIMQCIDIRF